MAKTKSNVTLILRNYQLTPLANWLSKLSLAGKESRERTRFIQILGPRLQEAEKVRKDIQDKYALKDDKGKVKRVKDTSSMKVVGEDGKEINPKEDIIDFGKNADKAKEEWDEYYQEDFVIDVSEGNKSKVYVVADIVLNTTVEFTGWDATVYAEWCEAFEELPDRRQV